MRNRPEKIQTSYTAIYLSIIIFSLFFHSPGISHQYHISICKLNYLADSSLIKISFQLFTDDLLNTLESTSRIPLNFFTEDEHPNADQFLMQYINSHVSIEINEQKRSLKFIKKEEVSDATRCYFQISNINGLKEVKITNQILLETFEDQMNIVHINTPTTKKMFSLHQGTESKTLLFD